MSGVEGRSTVYNIRDRELGREGGAGETERERASSFHPPSSGENPMMVMNTHIFVKRRPNHVTAKSCSARSIHKKSTAAATGRHHPFPKKTSAHRGAFASRTKRTAVQPQAQSAEQQRTHGRTSVSGPLGSAASSTTVLPLMLYKGIKQ